MSAKFNVFSQTVQPLTTILYVMVVGTYVKQMECNFETKWCKSTPKNFQPPAKDKKPNNRGQLQSVKADCSCQKHRVEKFVKELGV